MAEMHRRSTTRPGGHIGRPGRLVLGAVVACVAILAAACGSSSGGTEANAANTAASQPVDGGSVVFGVSAETSGWNPHYDEWAQAGSMVASSVLEPLATMGPDNGAKPWLAESWIANDTFTAWSIKLKEGITFQNGEPFDAAAVRMNIEDAVSGPLSGQALAGLFKQVSVVDDTTVLVELTQPWAAFPSSFLDGQSATMMAPAMLRSADHGQAHPIGTGPFAFDSWSPGDTFVTKRNPTYWQKGLPHLEQLAFKVIPDSTTRTAALESGDINIMLTTSAADANKLESGYTVVKDWDTEPGMVMLNTAPKTAKGDTNPLSDLHARKAIAYATDQQAIAASIGEGVLTPTSPFSPDNPWGMPQDQNGYPAYDLEQAKAEVAAYKADTGASSLSFTVKGVADVDTTRTLQLLQSQWQAAGIDASIDSVESTTFITQAVSGDYEAAMFQIYSSPDPDQNHYFWSADTIKGPGGVNINFSQYTSPQIEADLQTGRESGFAEQRRDAYHDLVKQLNAAVTDVWLYWTPFSLVAERQLHGLDQATDVRFGNFQPKTWLADLWREQ